MYNKKLENAVKKTIDKVRRLGDKALCEYTLKFDDVRLTPSQFLVPKENLKQSWQNLPPKFKNTVRVISARIKRFHIEEKKRLGGTSWHFQENGIQLGQRFLPVDSTGIYVPGGRYSYPSTVLMTAIPARVAGVKHIIMVTPPKHLTTELMGCAFIAGVDELYSVGGPQAIAALAYGTKTLPKVDMIVGPGGTYVTEAKRQVYGQVGIDGLAGPSEIVIVADGNANPEFVAGDMEAQAEHDPNARAILVSLDKKLLVKVKTCVSADKLKQCRFVMAKGITEAADLVNTTAPEHLLVALKSPDNFLQLVRHAGAIFVGEYSTVVLGDYVAGPSHVLPTGVSARFSSGLSVMTFLKRSSIIKAGRKAFMSLAPPAIEMAASEGMLHHANSIKVRMAKSKGH